MEGNRMAVNGPILVTGAAGQLGAVGRTVTGATLHVDGGAHAGHG
jgi:hypothetical protein